MTICIERDKLKGSTLMTGVQRIVDDVRARLAAHDQTLNDRLRLLADEYHVACSEAEARLRRCEEFARSGYRGEALYLAEVDPPLLEILSVLSFPERKAWAELTGMYDLPEAPPLSLARAKELNKVYAEYAKVEPMVTRLRHLGRTRAPLTERAAVLRELRAADRNCPVWVDQLGAMETELRAELIRNLEADLRSGDRARMFEYYSALTAPGWLKPAIPAVIAKAAVECLPRMLAQLNQAVGRDDLAAARQARAEWDRVARDAMLLPNDPIAERAAVLLEEVGRMEDRAARSRDQQEALEVFREAVHRGAPADELTRTYDRVRETGAKLPRPLLDQYHRQLARHERGRDIRQTILGIIAITLGAVILVTFLVLVLGR
jgi:hypothetical protein